MATANQAILEKLRKMREDKARLEAQKDVDRPTEAEVAARTSPTEVAQTPLPDITVKPKGDSKIANDPEHEKFYEQLCLLEQALNEQMPNFAMILRDVHRAMADDVNVVTLMTEDEIGIVTAGLAKHADIEIIEPKKAAAKKTSGGRLNKNLTEDSI